LVFSQESPNYIQIEKYLNGKPKPGGKSLQNLGGNKLTILKKIFTLLTSPVLHLGYIP
jgi:hypothetical protein